MLGDHSKVLDGLEGKDFLRSSIKVSLENIRNSKDVISKIEKIPGIQEVRNRQDIINKVIILFILLAIIIFPLSSMSTITTLILINNNKHWLYKIKMIKYNK